MTRASADHTPAQSSAPEPRPPLYLVATSHLDTQWRWSIRTTIRHFLKKTLLDNLERMRTHPGYVLSFEGAFRYQLAQEYYPDLFLRVRQAAASGRWRVAGSMLDAPDTILPAPEALIRHILYGNGYFEATFGRRSVDVFLPDCFGFPWSLPTLARHCGLLGFSSQKFIKWFAPKKLPFDIGRWRGPDGSDIVAVLHPGGYGEPLRDLEDPAGPDSFPELDRDPELPTYRYFGVGDRGGAPDAASLDRIERARRGRLRTGARPLVHTGSDQFFRDLDPGVRERLPVHDGELLLPTHGTGCWTSHAILKTWNRRCEGLALAAERSALLASWLGGPGYPDTELRSEWTRFLWHQMHDDLTGTSAPEAYRFSWNDLLVAQNRLGRILADSVRAVARGLDTRTAGIPVVVFNPLPVERDETLELAVRDLEAGVEYSAVDPTGGTWPCQVESSPEGKPRLVVRARLAPLSVSVLEIRKGNRLDGPEPDREELDAGSGHLENWKYRIELDGAGGLDVFDKQLGRRLFESPLDLVLLPDRSRRWPAWEILRGDLGARERLLDGPATARVVAAGPVRAVLEIERPSGPSRFRQRLTLAASSSSRRFDLDTWIDWRHSSTLLKARFALAAGGTNGTEPAATYDLGVGAIQRGVNEPGRHEVPAQDWADLSCGDAGVSIIAPTRYGWDRPAANVLRLSLLRAPAALRRFAHQATQDRGRHHVPISVLGHGGDWRRAGTVAEAERVAQPAVAFVAESHPGPLGRSVSLLELEGTNAALMALKQAEDGNGWTARVRETAGTGGEVRLRSPGRPDPDILEQLSGAETAVATEQPPAAPTTESSRGAEDDEPSAQTRTAAPIRLGAFALETVRLRPPAPAAKLSPARVEPLELPFDHCVASWHQPGSRASPCDFDGRGRSWPGELMPAEIRCGETRFVLGPWAPGAPAALACRGQRLALPGEGFRTLAFLACSVDPGGSLLELEVSGGVQPLRVPYYSGFLGQWKRYSGRLGFLLRRIRPGYLERAPVAWLASHQHTATVRDEVYTYCYLFRFEVPLEASDREIVLPEAPDVRLFAATASDMAFSRLEAATVDPADTLPAGSTPGAARGASPDTEREPS